MGIKGSKLKARRKQPHLRSKPEGTRRLIDGIFLIDRLLRTGRGRTLAELSEALESSDRTVQRYIEFMQDSLGVEILHDRTRGGYVYAADGLNVPAARLTDEELLALYVASPVLAQYRGTPLEAEFASAFERITRGLPDRVRATFAPVLQRFGVKAVVPTSEDVDRFRALWRAVLGDQQLSITYHSAHRGVTSKRIVDPYALRAVLGHWYLVAACHERREIVPFHVSRIKSVAETGTIFVRPADLDIEALFSGALGAFRGESGPDDFTVRLVFSPVAARYARETEWHPSQQLEERPDGSLEMTLALSNLVEIERFVLGFGDGVEVLEPLVLRARIADTHRRAARLYASEGQDDRPS